MEGYFKDKEDSWYEVPENISTVLVEPISGKPATDSDSKKKPMYFIKGTEPSNADLVFDEIFKESTAT